MNKKYIKNFAILFFLVFGIFFTTLACYANDVVTIEAKKRETREKIKTLKFLESLETNKLYKNQQRLEVTQETLSHSERQLHTTEYRLNELEYDLAKTRAKYAATTNYAKNRVRQIYKKQRMGIIQLLLSAQDVNVFLDRIYYQKILTRQDRRKIAEAKMATRRMANLRNSIEQEKYYIANSIHNINYQKTTLKKAIDKNEDLIQKLRTDRMAYERAEKELARQSETIGNMINKTTRHSETRTSSTFMKPIAGRITSPFGWRVHPIFKSRTFHSGLDIGGLNYGEIRAANSGKVIFVGWYGGYGKVVIIDHGLYNGKATTTLYAHLSSWSVSVGTQVKKGQVIAREGSTGYSTGPHLHFEVRVNGTPTNPLNYI